ncbi:MAG: hypothetical protein RIA69_16650 [Cyclobacteriaceae bacterium]
MEQSLSGVKSKEGKTKMLLHMKAQDSLRIWQNSQNHPFATKPKYGSEEELGSF